MWPGKWPFLVQIIQINLVLKNREWDYVDETESSNNTNKLSPQEQWFIADDWGASSNNTNKLSPQERNI